MDILLPFVGWRVWNCPNLVPEIEQRGEGGKTRVLEVWTSSTNSSARLSVSKVKIDGSVAFTEGIAS
jgi:hypothetical protein